jgi:cobalt-zinc-cadmium efflux system membrane fusion protein
MSYSARPSRRMLFSGTGFAYRRPTLPGTMIPSRSTMSEPAPTPSVNPVSPDVPPASQPVHHDAGPHGSQQNASRLFKAMQGVSIFVIVSAIVVVFMAFVLGIPIPGMHAAEPEINSKETRPLGVQLVGRHTLEVPAEVRAALGIRKGGQDEIEIVKAPTKTRPLMMYGSTALDPTRLMRIRARFAPAEVVSIGEVLDVQGGKSVYRELRPGDRVKKGDILGVFFSVDVGSRKNDLLDALVQLMLDQKVLDGIEKALHSVPEVQYWNALRAVQGDRNAVNRAFNNLRVWNIPQEDIDALHEEAKRISSDKDAWHKTPAGRWVAGEKQTMPGTKVDMGADKNDPWGRVTLRAPFDGIVVERNIVPHEMVVDNTVNLFQIAQVQRLLVVANAPEDELPSLNALTPEQRKWTVKTVGLNGTAEIEGPIEEVGYLIDPNQHTAVIKGYIDNPKEQIRAGQFVAATVQIPPPRDVVEVPLDAIVEDGQSCVVFVQTDAQKHHYKMRRVQIVSRFEHTAFVRGRPFSKQEQELTPEEKVQNLQVLRPLRAGERILKTAVGELKAALLDLESHPIRES